MRSARSNPAFDHGAALRVPPANDTRNWHKLWAWLGDDAHAMTEAGITTSLAHTAAKGGVL